MDPYSIWKYLLARFRRQLPLDVEHCSPIALRHILLDIKTPASVLERIAHAYCDDEDIMRELVIKESTKQISLPVLDNPRLTEGEIEAFAKSANLGEDVIRTIGMNAD